MVCFRDGEEAEAPVDVPEIIIDPVQDREVRNIISDFLLISIGKTHTKIKQDKGIFL